MAASHSLARQATINAGGGQQTVARLFVAIYTRATSVEMSRASMTGEYINVVALHRAYPCKEKISWQLVLTSGRPAMHTCRRSWRARSRAAKSWRGALRSVFLVWH